MIQVKTRIQGRHISKLTITSVIKGYELMHYREKLLSRKAITHNAVSVRIKVGGWNSKMFLIVYTYV